MDSVYCNTINANSDLSNRLQFCAAAKYPFTQWRLGTAEQPSKKKEVPAKKALQKARKKTLTKRKSLSVIPKGFFMNKKPEALLRARCFIKLAEINGCCVNENGNYKESDGKILGHAAKLCFVALTLCVKAAGAFSAESGHTIGFAALKKNSDGDKNAGYDKKNTSDDFVDRHNKPPNNTIACIIITQLSPICKSFFKKTKSGFDLPCII